MSDEKNGENVAATLIDFVHDDSRGEIREFIAEISRAEPADKRKLAKLIKKIAEELSRADVITTRNCDYVNYFKHVHLCAGGLPLEE